jgi:uncharacterized protein with PIN domain
MKKTEIDYSQFVRRQKPYKVVCSQCLETLEGDSEEEVLEKLEEEKWVVFDSLLYCNKCYYWE